jgi:predicted metalloprotease with PDZ domain
LVKLHYDVKSLHDSVADSFIDDKRAYIYSPGMFMYPDGHINQPVTVTLIPPPHFSTISTGLEPCPGKRNTFSARNFDILYDCPIYMGNQEVISFEVRGIPHHVAMENPGTFNRRDFTAGLKKMIETAAAIVGDIPYRHYSFIMDAILFWK